jgi:hypothetical protein
MEICRLTWTTENLKEDGTYWAQSGVDSSGDPSFTAPVFVKCKWEERTELFVGPDGREQRSRAVVFLDTDVIIGGYLFLGKSTTADPLTVSDAILIKDFRKIKDFEAEVSERRAIL